MIMERVEPTYSESCFWRKAAKVAKRAGVEIVEKALMLFYTAQHPNTPKWAKSVIYGSLAYFVMPLDAIPDFIPVAGFTDDLAAIVAGLSAVTMYLTPEIKTRAKEKAKAILSREFYREETPNRSENS